ncbi:MAG: hypothetical protein CVU39_23625 [Chloroflexi bacterium HGW-Chloroflexi-10]|nr:MAG: hypothetical protein CVU39_23625 [Chloroflexi bacterium HGW-Chloroflexi-10]
MNIQLTLALRYLGGRKLRTFLTTLAIVFGVMVIFGMNIVLPTMIAALQSNIMAASGQVDLTITRITGDLFDQAVAAEIQSVNGVQAVSGTLNRSLNLPGDYFDQDAGQTDRVTALSLVGIDPQNATIVRSYPLLEGRFLQAGDNNAVVIAESLADKIGVGVGDTFNIPTVQGEKTLTVVGMLFPRMTPGNEELLVLLPYVQETMNATGKINAMDINLEVLDDADRRAEITAMVEAKLGEDYQIGALSSGDEMLGVLGMGRIMLSTFGALALFMGAFIIFNTFRTVILERRHDIGLLRAVGASRRTITWLIVMEGMLQGVIGSVIGIALGYLMGLGIIRLAQGPLSAFINLQMSNPVVEPGLVLVCLLLGVGVTILAGLFPALQAARVTPMDALRPSLVDVDYRRRTGLAFIAGLGSIGLALMALFAGDIAFTGLGAFLFLLGLVLVAPALVRPLALIFGKVIARVYARQGIGELAQGNLVRQPGRVAITASATMLGLAVVVAAGGSVSSLSITMTDLIKSSLGSDFLFVPPSVSLWSSDIGVSVNFENGLKAIEQVDVVSSLRYASSQANDMAISVLGIDPLAYSKVSSLSFVEGSESDYAQLNEPGTMFVNGVLAMNMGLKVGDTLEMVTPNGRKPYRVVAIGSDLLNAKVVTAYVSQANLEKDFNVTEDVFIQLNLKQGADAVAAEAAIKALAVDFPQFTVISGKAYYTSLLAQMETAFAGMYFLLAVLAVPSLIAMLNTLAISVIERTREIGMLRAVGATQKQVRKMITSEALLLASVGTAFGILGGLYLGYVFVSAMEAIMPSRYVFPLTAIFAAIVIGLTFGLLAALLPSRQAAKLDVVKALRYE